MQQVPVWQPQSNTWASPGSVDRNKRPIADALSAFLSCRKQGTQRIFEVASGFGHHVVEFARDHPEIVFQPSEAQAECLEALKSVCGGNIMSPIKLNVLDKADWAACGKGAGNSYDGLLCINMIHISPPASTQALFEGASMLLREGGFLLLYGAYLTETGAFASENDALFDGSLKLRDASFGLRHPAQVRATAEMCGFEYLEQREMPLNNRLYLWCKQRST